MPLLRSAKAPSCFRVGMICSMKQLDLDDFINRLIKTKTIACSGREQGYMGTPQLSHLCPVGCLMQRGSTSKKHSRVCYHHKAGAVKTYRKNHVTTNWWYSGHPFWCASLHWKTRRLSGKGKAIQQFPRITGYCWNSCVSESNKCRRALHAVQQQG